MSSSEFPADETVGILVYSCSEDVVVIGCPECEEKITLHKTGVDIDGSLEFASADDHQCKPVPESREGK